MIKACNETIPISKPTNCKSVPGWNDDVKEHFQLALFWHNMWVENNTPVSGAVAELRRYTRKKYHQACKMVMRLAGQIRCNKTVQSLRCNSMSDFWRQAKKFRKHNVNYPNDVDGVEGKQAIANLFADKYEQLYNIVSYDQDDIYV